MSRIRFFALVGFYLTSLFGALSNTVTAKEIVLAADNWCPFNCDANSKNPGILVEMAQMAFANSGYKIKYIEMPWKRAILQTRRGLIDGIIGTGPDETPDFIFPDKPLIVAEHTFFTRTGENWKYTGLDSLSTRKLGVIDGYSYGDLHLAYIKPARKDKTKLLIVSGENPLERLYGLLDLGRVDTIIEESLVFKNQTKEIPGSQNIQSAGVYAREDIYIALSPALKHSESLSEILSQYIKTLDKENMQKLISKYTR